MEHPEEGEWVRQARAGDRAAFAALVDRYWDRLRRWLFALTRQEHLAEDLTQEAFLRAWQALPTLEGPGGFRPWLFRIARNCLLDRQRGPRGAEARSLPADLQAKGTGPVGDVLEREAQQMLQAALARLPTDYRAAYVLWTQEDMPYCQIAQVLAISEETARWRVCKARQFLLRELQPYLDVPKP